MKTYYADYVNHILRFYTRYAKRKKAGFHSKIDRLNYAAADRVFSKLTPIEQNILTEVYTRRDTLGDNVFEVAKTKGISQDVIWALITTVSNSIAKERDLI